MKSGFSCVRQIFWQNEPSASSHSDRETHRAPVSFRGGSGQSEATVPIPEHTVTLVAFGDSTTAPRERLEVYSELLEKELKAKTPVARVINAGVRGNNTEDASSRFQKDVLDQKPDLVVIQFGINDSAVDVWKQPPADKPRVDLKVFRNHLQYFIRTLKTRGGRKVVLMTPNPLRWTARLRELYGKAPYHPEDPEGMNRLLHTYAAAVRELALEESVALVDVDAAFPRLRSRAWHLG